MDVALRSNVRVALVVAFISSAVACGNEPAPMPPGPRQTARTPAKTPPRPVPGDGLDDPEPTTPSVPTTPTPTAPSPTALAPLVPPSPNGAPPARGCIATAAPVLVWPHDAPPAITAHGSAFVVAAIARNATDDEELFIARLPPGAAPSPIGTHRIGSVGLEERSTPPAIAALDATDVAVAAIDAQSTVHAGRVSVSPPAGNFSLTTLRSGADTRMAPTVRGLGRRIAVAYTDGSGTPMRVQLVVLGPDDRAESTRDVTPTSMGASAPTFVDGLETPTLVFVDARAGISPIVRLALSADGAPGASQVMVPVGTVWTPPELAVGAAGGSAWVGYTVVGRLAASAVGLVKLDRSSAPPTSLVPGSAYSQLHVAAAATPNAVIFAADAPIGPGRNPAHEVHVRRVDETGAGPALVLRAPEGTAAHAAIARREDGTLGVAFTAASGVYVQTVRCE